MGFKPRSRTFKAFLEKTSYGFMFGRTKGIKRAFLGNFWKFSDFRPPWEAVGMTVKDNGQHSGTIVDFWIFRRKREKLSTLERESKEKKSEKKFDI